MLSDAAMFRSPADVPVYLHRAPVDLPAGHQRSGSDHRARHAARSACACRLRLLQSALQSHQATALGPQRRIATLTRRIALLEEQFRLAQLKRFAPKSEKQADRLFGEAKRIAAAKAGAGGEDADAAFALPETGLPPSGEPARGRRGRKPLPAVLTSTRIENDLPDGQKACACCGHYLHRMNEQTSKQLHIEVKASVLQHVRLTYACRCYERPVTRTPMVTAQMPAQLLPGGHASPALNATVMTGKYADGTPLYRKAQALTRANITVGRGTLAHCIIHPAGRHLSGLVAALHATLLAQPLLSGHQTTMQIKEYGKSAQCQSYAWVDRSAADSDCPVILFDYEPGCGEKHPQAFLSDWHGTLMSDDYSAWHMIEGATHLGCAANARRKVDEARTQWRTFTTTSTMAPRRSTITSSRVTSARSVPAGSRGYSPARWPVRRPARSSAA
jgi:transposase